MITAKIIADSISEDGVRITTMELEYPRFIHGEMLTHRCLVGETKLSFDLPSGVTGSEFKLYEMSMKEFHDKWHKGSSPRKPSQYVERDMSGISSGAVYTAKEASILLEMSGASNIRGLCRKGVIKTQNPNKGRTEDHLILGEDLISHYGSPRMTSHSMRSRLKKMRIRMLDEDTNKVCSTHVTDIWKVGEKETFRLKAGGREVCATADHKILTEHGWRELQDIKVGDKVMASKKGVEERSDPLAHKKINGQWVSKWNKQVIQEVSDRQGGVCEVCTEAKTLEIHHLKPVHQYPELAFDITNVVAVCSGCHRSHYHAKQGWQKDVGQGLIGALVEVEEIVANGVEEVYDLSVESDFHNFFADGIVVHNCFSRNAASSRAIPIKKMIEQVERDPAIPSHWGKNQSGMQAKEELTGEALEAAQSWWDVAANQAAEMAHMLSLTGLHKQVVNRVLEPFQRMKTVVTATEWDNFSELRNHKDAQPEIQMLAKEMLEGMEKSTPALLKAGQWHLPYVDYCEELGYTVPHDDDYENGRYDLTLEEARMVSASCCAQVSYRVLDTDIKKAKAIFDKLITSEPRHSSPFEHVATPMPDDLLISKTERNGITHVDRFDNAWSGNFREWIQWRQVL